LARLQTALVERALRAEHPGLEIECLTRKSAGDQDQTSPLWKLPDKGAFTADLSQALIAGDADLVVHSFKDLPIEMPAGSHIAGALPRADARDVVLIKQSAIDAQPDSLRILSSSPRRGWLLGEVMPALLPWRTRTLDAIPVRGNIETRLRKLVEGDAHGLVVAKAALDRLLGFGPPFDREAAAIRDHLQHCRWMVMPMREFPWAPAQGAIAIEVASARTGPRTGARTDRLRGHDGSRERRAPRTGRGWRRVSSGIGRGDHRAALWRVVSVRSRATQSAIWELQRAGPAFPRVAAARVWPEPGVSIATGTSLVDRGAAASEDGFWVARAEALPERWPLMPDVVVWAAGTQTWRRLAARGVWVNGCADGLGDDEHPPIDVLAGRSVKWVRLTHDRAGTPDALPTYHVDTPLPDDLPERSHFFWTSGDLFKRAIERWPAIRDAWHASGPGHTRDTIRDVLGVSDRIGVWLDRASWERDVCL
jgi:hydroxymethylbilane synthase